MTTEQRLSAALEGRYHVERELGEGGMATVYLANDLKHGRDVAIKVLHPDLAAALGGDRFLTEIRTTARLQHPHILPLLDSGVADGESPRRLTMFGSDPAWSPDSRRIVFATEETRNPYSVSSNSELWITDVDGGEPAPLFASGTTAAYQPAWSPSGDRIAYWSVTAGQRISHDDRGDWR